MDFGLRVMVKFGARFPLGWVPFRGKGLPAIPLPSQIPLRWGGGTLLEVGILAKHLARYRGTVAAFFFAKCFFAASAGGA